MMSSFNWKKYLIVVFDIAIAVYLLLAITAFNRPAEKATVCSEVKIDIDGRSADGGAGGENLAEGFLNASEVKRMLEGKKLYPLAQPMADISTRDIEEQLEKNPFVEKAECYKTQSGHVCIRLKQRMPIVHVMPNSGDSYYVDTEGSILPETRYTTDLVVATGNISRKYAQKQLAMVANKIQQDKFWQNQTEQINVLADGSVELVPRVGDHIIYLGAPTNIDRKLERMEKFYKYGLNEAGWNKYKYISVEFSNQIICKRRSKLK